MKTVFNRLPAGVVIFSAVVATAGFVLAPVSSFALERNATTAATPKTSPFCTELSTRADTITGQVSGAANKATQAWAQQDQKQAAENKKVDQDVAADRQKADTERTADFSKLEAKATTDARKQAVQAYETAVHSAITTRRASYDAARQTFRTNLKNAVAARRSTVTAQLGTFESATSAAISTAKASCASDPSSGPTTRQTMVASLKTARQAFQSGRKDDETVGSQVKQFATARTAAFKAADQAFQASLTTARQPLKQAFDNKNTV